MIIIVIKFYEHYMWAWEPDPGSYKLLNSFKIINNIWILRYGYACLLWLIQLYIDMNLEESFFPLENTIIFDYV